MPKTLPFYTRAINFESVGITPQQILALQIPEDLNLRAEELVTKEKEAELTPGEKEELDFYEHQDHFLSILKIRAMEMLNASGA